MDINLSSQIVVQTAAQWAADNTVYSAKRILVTSDEYYGSTDQRKFKIADGVQTWSNLDYMPIEQVTTSTIGSAINGATSATPNDTDLVMSVDTSVAKKNTWTQIKAFLKTYFDTVYKATFTENTAFNKNFGTGTTNIVEIGSTLGNSLITSTDANGKLQTLATSTYPSLTELSYVKGLTSAVQTQFSDIRRSYQIITGTLAPADSTTYYSNATSDTSANWSTNIAVYKSQIPITGTIKECSIIVFNNNNPTSEASTLILRNLTTSTDYTLSNGVTFDSTNGVWKPLTIITGLNIPISAGNNFVLKLTTPAWSINPTSIRIAVNLSISL